MFDGEAQMFPVASQVQVAVAPAVQVAGAAQGLAGAVGLSALAGVVHQEHGQMKLPLQVA